ncbi:unnamed protein product, partial [Didymodactylos carnosus]
MSTAVTE